MPTFCYVKLEGSRTLISCHEDITGVIPLPNLVSPEGARSRICANPRILGIAPNLAERRKNAVQQRARQEILQSLPGTH